MTMKARRGGLLAGLLVLAGAASGGAADVAVLKSSDAPAWRPTIDALRKSAVGHNVTEYDLRSDRATADGILASLKGRTVILVALGPLAAQAAKAALPEAPTVYAMVQDPARTGIVGMPGVSYAIPIKNQLAAFRMVNPRGVRIGVVYNPDNVGRQVEEAEKAAGLLRIVLIARPVAAEKDVPAALRSLLTGTEAVDALWLPPDPTLLSDDSRRFILTETLKASRPVYSFSAALVGEGALVSNGPDFVSIGEQLAEVVSRLAGGDRSRMEALVPRAELVINKKIAGKLKIEVPPDALKAASKVF
jgi:putative tryptophan/tyrosine transport system substrate-binding protein